MSYPTVRIRELAAWGFDPYPYRPEILQGSSSSAAAGIVADRSPCVKAHILLESLTEELRELFNDQISRPDLLSEMAGLSWSLGVVDLRQLIAFQRRLAFSPAFVAPPLPRAGDWPSLFALSFGPAKAVEYTLTRIRESANAGETFVLKSANSDLHLRVPADIRSPFQIHAGGPFLEVACYRERWFLRDGYHRTHTLLQAGVFEVPAVIVRARTLEELGANGPDFFAEEVLFSETPPRVIDFLNQELVLQYERAPFLKTIRIQIEENLEPATRTGEHP